MIETNNVLTNPSGLEYQFLVGEGTLADSSSILDVHPSNCTAFPRYLCVEGRPPSCDTAAAPL